MTEYNVYLIVAITGFFSGFGNLLAQFVWSEILKPKVDQWHKKIKESDINPKQLLKNGIESFSYSNYDDKRYRR